MRPSRDLAVLEVPTQKTVSESPRSEAHPLDQAAEAVYVSVEEAPCGMDAAAFAAVARTQESRDAAYGFGAGM